MMCVSMPIGVTKLHRQVSAAVSSRVHWLHRQRQSPAAIRPVHTEDAFDARVVNRSKNTGYLECDVTDPDGKRVAKATSTCMVLRGEQAKIR
jgi:hypothetical protein